MAGDWIKMRSDLFTHPKVVRIVSAFNADECPQGVHKVSDNLRVIGGLMSVWCLFDAHSVDGILDGYSFEYIDSHVRWDGFAKQMEAVGWLVNDGESLSLPSFDTHNGESAKRRAQDADRKRKVRKMSANKTDKTRTREEKRREEKSIIKNKADPVEYPDVLNLVAWHEYLEYRKQKKIKAYTDSGERKQIDWLCKYDRKTQEEIISLTMRQGWTGLFEPKGETSGTTPEQERVKQLSRSAAGRVQLNIERENSATKGHDPEALGDADQNLRPPVHVSVQ